MNFVYFLAVLTALLALAARRQTWAVAAGMASGAGVVLAALVVGVPTRTLLLCLLAPAAVALWPKGGRR